jgi:dihydroorotate dehydrogenase electron transfer subunit
LRESLASEGLIDTATCRDGTGGLSRTASPATASQERPLAPFGRRLLTVTGNERLGAYRVLRVADPEELGGERVPNPGQFAMLATAERWGAGADERPYLPRAFSYARFARGEAHFLLEDVGPGTRRLCDLGDGESLWLLGPLGQGFGAPEDGRRALLVGGGVGIAPLAIWWDRLDAAGEASTVLLGFRDSAHAEGAALFNDLSRGRARGRLALASDDGSVGHHGFVTSLLRAELDRDAHAVVYACGPPLMLEAVRALCAARRVTAQLALEAGMACGFGACFGCVVPTREGYMRVCVDGPVVEADRLGVVAEHGGAGA